MRKNRRVVLKKALSVALALSMTTGTTFTNAGMVSYADVETIDDSSDKEDSVEEQKDDSASDNTEKTDSSEASEDGGAADSEKKDVGTESEDKGEKSVDTDTLADDTESSEKEEDDKSSEKEQDNESSEKEQDNKSSDQSEEGLAEDTKESGSGENAEKKEDKKGENKEENKDAAEDSEDENIGKTEDDSSKQEDITTTTVQLGSVIDTVNADGNLEKQITEKKITEVTEEINEKEIPEKKYKSDEGSTNIEKIIVPELAVDEDSVSFVWEKPENYAKIADYKVYMGDNTDGKYLGTASENYAKHADWAETYRKAFYNKHTDAVKISIHTFYADGLEPDTDYTFTVVPVDKSGDEIDGAQTVDVHTAKSLDEDEIHYITEYGAKSVDEAYTSYDDEINAEIERNTKAIQAAIDACGEGEKVVIPEGIYMSGAIYLHSNMTLELEKGAVLKGSPNVDHYDQNYILYPYSTDTRSWSLVNVYTSDEEHPYENIRIVGEGTIDGNGWKNISKDSKHGEDPKDKNYESPQYYAGSNSKVVEGGILAKDASVKAAERSGGDPKNPTKIAYNTRPSLVMIRGSKNIYIEGVTLMNPAYHTLAVLDSDTITANNVKYLTYDDNNADGIEIGNTQHAMIYNSFFDTGDDAVNFATGMGKAVEDTKQQSSSYIWTFDNVFRECHGGAIAAGSHTGAGISDMLVEDNVLNYADMPFRFKSAPANGGSIHDVLIRDCAVANCDQLFVMTTMYSDSNGVSDTETAEKPAEFYNINAYNITCDSTGKNAFSLIADIDANNPSKPLHHHHDLYFQDITVKNSANYKTNSKIDKVQGDVLDGIEDATFYNVDIKHKDGKEAWNDIINCKGLHFYEGSESSKTKNAETVPEWDEEAEISVASPSEIEVASASQIAVRKDSVKKLDSGDYRLTLDFIGATDKDLDGKEQKVSYSVETYLDDGDTLVDVSGLFGNSTKAGEKITKTVEHLSAGVEYLFKVFAYDETGNKTEGPGITYAIDEESSELDRPSNLGMEKLKADVYTSVPIDVADARKVDGRIRGYRTYVDGELNETYYYYQLGSSKFNDGKVTIIADRLTSGTTDEETNRKENDIKVVAFADDGQEFAYDEAVSTTWQMYDFTSPIWESHDITVAQDGDDLVLSWDEAQDDSGIVGYRVYMDGKAVYDGHGDYFNHVNGAYTTEDTTFRLSGLDLTVDHTFKVTAGDNWWRAQKNEAPYHWTNDYAEGVWSVSQTTDPEENEKPDDVNDEEGKEADNKGNDNKSNDSKDISKDSDSQNDASGQKTSDEGTKSQDNQNAEKDGIKVNDEKSASQSGTSRNSSGSSDGSSSSDRDSDSDSSSSSSSSSGSTGRVLGANRVDESTMGFWAKDAMGWKFRSLNGESAINSWKECEYNGVIKWYRFDQNGYMQSGWYVDTDGNLYYLSTTHDGTFGQMLTGWQTIDGKEYFFETDSAKKQGRIYMNEYTPDGHFVGADCAKVK